jgi:hypothetical protein
MNPQHPLRGAVHRHLLLLFITAVPITKLFAWWEGTTIQTPKTKMSTPPEPSQSYLPEGSRKMCTGNDENGVCMCVCVCVCVCSLLQHLS